MPVMLVAQLVLKAHLTTVYLPEQHPRQRIIDKSH
jgi:hypothetical protein